ncbi:MAG: KamA family protein [Oligoflexia bacterium]|nr:KamA family protein [Oligoflexia bacterium]
MKDFFLRLRLLIGLLLLFNLFFTLNVRFVEASANAAREENGLLDIEDLVRYNASDVSDISNVSKVLSDRARIVLQQIIAENDWLMDLIRNSNNEVEFNQRLTNLASDKLGSHAQDFYQKKIFGTDAYKRLSWNEIAAIRILDYINNSGRVYHDFNFNDRPLMIKPFVVLKRAIINGVSVANEYFFEDMLHLLRQFNGQEQRVSPSRDMVLSWMDRYSSGLEPEVVAARERNVDRILHRIAERRGVDFETVLTEWNDDDKAFNFIIKNVVRDPQELNEMLDNSLSPETMDVLMDAQAKQIPTFINPYTISLLDPTTPDGRRRADQAIRDSVLYSRSLVENFSRNEFDPQRIRSWEKEDKIVRGKPNAAGWLLLDDEDPDMLHRRYPEVAIIIPRTTGRTCGGLCSYCQRMYGFQNGKLDFDYGNNSSWSEQLHKSMEYFRNDSQLRDILVTGGDALMSSDAALAEIFDAILQMAEQKKEDNLQRKDGEKFAEMRRVRLGTRLPVYVPQRITNNLVRILKNFKDRASRLGMEQFVVQTHFETPYEVTPEAKKAVARLLSAGWIVTNQLVFTNAASRRGHSAKLRQVLGDIGVITYYTFTTKGGMENYTHFVPGARSVQESLEEKVLGAVPAEFLEETRTFPTKAETLVQEIDTLRRMIDAPFLSFDRNVLNLPGVGKSLSFRVIGITNDGRRILEFDHDVTRKHSPIIEHMDKIVIIESKSIREYLDSISAIGEDEREYDSVWGHSIGQTEKRHPIYEYPAQNGITTQFTNYQRAE